MRCTHWAGAWPCRPDIRPRARQQKRSRQTEACYCAIRRGPLLTCLEARSWLQYKRQQLPPPRGCRPISEAISPNKDKPRPGRPGLRNGRRVAGCRGMPSVQFEDRSCRWRLRRRRLLIQPPGIAALFELGDSVIGDRKSFLFGQSFFQAANDLPGAPECESDRVPKHFSLGHGPKRTYREQYCKPLHLARLP